MSAAVRPIVSPVLAAAREYRKRGWQPLALLPKQKGIKVTGWQARRLTLDQLPEEFKNSNSNIGILLGEPSGVHDVDSDCLEALAVKGAFLPFTDAVFGRASKPRSHDLYNTGADEKTIQFRDPLRVRKKGEKGGDEKAVLIELRGTGGQTMFPPSIHPSGERVEWTSPANFTPTEVGYADLLKAVQKVAAAALLVRYYPGEGNRNFGAMALSGALLRGGFNEADTKQFIEVIARAAGDTEIDNRLSTIAATEKRIADGKPATGNPTCAELFGQPIWDKVREWLGLRTVNDIERDTAKAGREVIRCRIDDLPWTVDSAEKVLAANPARWGHYQNGGGLVRVSTLTPEDAAKDKSIKRQAGSIILKSATVPGLEDDLTRACAFQKLNWQKMWVPAGIPGKLAMTLISRDKFVVPNLVGVIEAPIMRADGTILTTPGYDEASALYLYSPPETRWLPVKERPSKADIAAAVQSLREPFSEFPYVSEADLSVMISAILTGLQRRLLETAPLHAFDASKSGYGKTLQCDCVSLTITGRRTSSFSVSGDEDELRKKLTTALLAGDSIMMLDNIEVPLKSSALCTILTVTEIADRILCTMTRPKLRTNVLFMASGNNLVFMGDMRTRVIISRLNDRTIEDPEERSNFKIKDLRTYILENRPQLVHAALTILRGFFVAGRPNTLLTYGRFEQWSDEIRAPLIWAGFADPCATRERIKKADPVLTLQRQIFSSWFAVRGTAKVTTGDLILATENAEAGTTLQDRTNLRTAMLETASDGGRGEFEKVSAIKFGKWCEANRDGVVDNLRLVRAGEKDGRALWQIEQMIKPEDAMPEPRSSRKVQKRVATPVPLKKKGYI